MEKETNKQTKNIGLVPGVLLGPQSGLFQQAGSSTRMLEAVSYPCWDRLVVTSTVFTSSTPLPSTALSGVVTTTTSSMCTLTSGVAIAGTGPAGGAGTLGDRWSAEKGQGRRGEEQFPLGVEGLQEILLQGEEEHPPSTQPE